MSGKYAKNERENENTLDFWPFSLIILRENVDKMSGKMKIRSILACFRWLDI